MTATTLSRRGLEAPASPIRALASIAEMPRQVENTFIS